MNRLLKLILVFLLTLFTTLAASEKETKDIAKISAASLYNIDKSSLEKTINAYVQSNQKLVGLKIVETLSGETYYKMYKKDGNIFFDKEFPNDINKNFKFTAESKYDNEPVGKVIAYFKETNKLNLTSEEIKWIKNNPFIKIATMKEWKPFDIPTTNGKQIGFHNDLINLLNKKSSMNLVLKPYESWKEAYEDVTTGEVYAITSLSYTKEREEKYFNYTDPYHFTPYQVIVKKSSNISSLRDLADKKIAIREKSIAKIIAEESIENPILNFYPRIEEVYKSIQSGVTEATLIANIEQETLSKYDLKVIDEVMHKASEIHIGVNKDYKTLSKIINKAVKAITLEEMSELRQKWFVEYMNASFEKYKSKINISLTNEEKKWLKAHKNIKFTADPMYLPYESFNEDGKYIGMVADYLKIIEETLEISFEKIPTISWTESLEKAYNAEVDILSNYTNDGSLKDIHISTKPYIESPIAVFTKNDLPKLNNLTNLKNKKVAVVKGYGYLKQIFKDYPDLNYIEVDNARVGMLGVSSGKYDAMICSLTLGVFKIGEHGLHNLQIALQTDYTMELGLGIRKDWKPLVGIINKVIDSISRGTAQEITKKWLGQKLDSINKVKLTQKEQAWIDKKTPVKYVYDPDWAPFEWTSELGSHTGILFELINIISERSGIIFEPITTNTWSEAVKMAENAEVDMYSGVGINEKRQSYMNFTKGTIYETPYVFVTHKTNEKDLFETFKSLSGDEKIGVLDNTIAHSILKEKHPDIFLTAVTSTMDGFKKLNEKKIDIFFINAATAKYYINNRGFTNLKIATKTKYTLELKVALQKTMPSEVISIIDKAIKTITERELTDIYRKWTEIQIEQEVDWNLVYKIAGSALIVLLLILYWNRKLKQTVEQKTSEITKLLHSFDENVIALKADLSGNITYVSHALCKMSGYPKERLIGKSHRYLKDPSTSKEFLENLLETVKKEEIWKGESRNQNSKGEFYWVYGIVTPEYDTDNNLIGYSDIKHDITAQKDVEKLSTELQKTLESFDDNVIASRSDLKGNITYASKEFARISGYTVDELIGKPHSTVRDPDMPKELFKDFWNTIQNGKVWRGEVKNRKKDGGFYWVDAVITPEFDEKNMIIAYSAIRHDITAQKEVEELSETLEHKVEERTSELKESQEQFSSMASNVPGVIYRCKVDAAWTMLYISHEIEKLSGYPVSDFINNSVRSFADIMNPKDIERVANLIQSQIDKGEKFLVDYRVISKDGEEKWVRSQGQSIIVNDELCIDGVLFDFTEQRALEEIIKQNNEQMTYVSQNANLGFWNFNPQIGDLYVNNVFVEMLGYKAEDVLIDGYENEMFKPFKDGLAFWEQLLHPEDAIRTGEVLTAHINGETNLYNVEYRMKRADGSWMWSRAVGRISKFDKNGKPIKFDGVNIDIDDAKTAQQEINNQKQYIDAIMNSQSNIVLSTDGEKIRTANQALFDFYGIESIEEFLEKFGNCICDTFDTDVPKEYLQKMMGEEKWIEYVYNRPDQIHKARITRDGKQNIFTITSDKFTVGDESLETAVFTNITELEKIREEVEAMHKHTQSSIEYASLIQHSLIPENDLFRKYFDDYLTIWHPKDIVGGDIYLFDELRNDNECLLIVIDCTGHGVPGAFVTMLVKAIERQIAAIIGNNPDQKVSPAWILQYFNHTMKHLLKQETEDAISNAGFDGGILYYNKKEKLIKFAGAEIPLFYTEPDSNEYKMIKGDRHSIGYKKSDADYKFTDHIIEAKEGMQFYLTTDGYIDQNGGEKGFPFGKKRFKALIEEYAQEPFANQQEVLLDALAEYQKDEERNDDITVVGVKLGKTKTTNNTKNIMWSI